MQKLSNACCRCCCCCTQCTQFATCTAPVQRMGGRSTWSTEACCHCCDMRGNGIVCRNTLAPREKCKRVDSVKRAVANILSELFILSGTQPGMWLLHRTPADLDRVSVLANGKSGFNLVQPNFFSSSGMSSHPLAHKLSYTKTRIHCDRKILESDNQRAQSNLANL